MKAGETVPMRDEVPGFFAVVLGAAVLGVALAFTPRATSAPAVAPAEAPAGNHLAQQGCLACHAPAAPGAGPQLAPPLDGIPARAAQRVLAPDYAGGAADVDGYLLESILDHCADPLPGWDCRDAPLYGNWLSLDEAYGLVDEMAHVP